MTGRERQNPAQTRMPETLSYAKAEHRTPRKARLLLAAAVALMICITVTIRGCASMDTERLFWEGGSDYYLENFPFPAVWIAGAAAAGLAVASLLRRERSRRIAAAVFLIALMLTSWFAYAYLSRIGYYKSRHAGPPALRWWR